MYIKNYLSYIQKKEGKNTASDMQFFILANQEEQFHNAPPISEMQLCFIKKLYVRFYLQQALQKVHCPPTL